ncbi:tyrosine--tRNA ligase, mitochondrial [Neodiprion virginianus]|uniref:tyrosine--tRNA ligase, mitochondrial n=1 Tax=Neodiprion fabricii TaxID=2872261 RepID=UPI001ED974CE|nr:tyrosine--tRNA ligase, mitochondrial [Neodiprion fabricii]XP_046414787.1 tyrosine--tRNA ligase, mitochondrial [Neodiprion fabricii]XP_046604204.1 tyrosine--tRNA ligase, mitochondrial [Neodiprion virginianus]XP_046604205.1 tyrosine--tRNA ligase, mitochondrial [Neodiprion virginianus]
MSIRRHLWRLCTACRHDLKNIRTYKTYKSRNVLRLYDRGMFQDIFPDTSAGEVIDLLNASSQTVYAGFDPTADSLHVGNLLVLMNLLHWQRSGHQVIALVGGATGQIGDPSHRKSARTEMEQVLINENIKGISRNIRTIFKNHEELFWEEKKTVKPVMIVNNIEWYKDINALDFLRSVGRYFRLGTMLSKTSVQTRLNSETGMSFAEFSYQVLQGYDWFHLLEKYNCRFQIGGSDQMGNIDAGFDLIGRATDKRVFGLTLPLITTESGEKFGKSAGNAIWLSENKSSSFQLYQFFIRTKDSDVHQLLKFFTFIPLGRISEIMVAHQKNPEQRTAQKILAEHVTRLVHGEAGLKTAQQTTSVLYDKSIESLSSLSADEMVSAFQGATLIEILPEPGLTVLQLSLKANCFPDETNAIRIITAGGFYINHQRIQNIEEIITPGVHIMPNNLTMIRVGKKTYYIVKWIS